MPRSWRWPTSISTNARFQEKHGGETLYADYHEMLEKEGLDIVSVYMAASARRNGDSGGAGRGEGRSQRKAHGPHLWRRQTDGQ
ncbi:MAG: hypothetical protein R2856_12735 [Caldilineaceae bacterium]